MLKLGHIVYANCYPPHAGILTQRVPFRVVEGIPTELNRLLYEGRIDVAPSSSIEYAMNPGRYLLLPDISITSKKKVMSILLESRVPIHELNRKVVALTTASATSIVLLRILLEVQHELEPGYTQYEQSVEDPAEQADAILSIGDLALTKNALPAFPHRYDLGELWHGFTGLPFVFGLWQVNYKKKNEQDLAALYDILVTSKAYGTSHLRELADSQAERFSIAPDRLYEYWESFSYDLGTEEQKGLLAFYKYAAQINVIEPVTDLRFWKKS